MDHSEKETRVYREPPMGESLNRGMSAAPDRPATELEDYAQQLSTLLVGLDRAALQYENVLDRLRGSSPSTGSESDQTAKRGHPDSTMPRLHSLMDGLLAASSRLNNAADELSGLI